MDCTQFEDVVEGDLAWARDETTGGEGWKPVAELSVTPGRDLLKLTFEAEDGTREVLLVTPEYPLGSLDERKWDNVGALALAEHVDTLAGPMQLVSALALDQTETVYNFEVADSHTYFVGESGFWVHNTCFPNAERLGEVFKTKNWHPPHALKEEIVRDTKAFGDKIGAKIPDIGINDAGNIVLRNQRSGMTIVTDPLTDWFLP